MESFTELHLILSRCGPNEAGKLACVSRKLQKLTTEDDLLWSKYLKDDLDLESPEDTNGNTSGLTYLAAYRLWRESFRRYPWSLVKRVKICWGRIKRWLSCNFPEAMATLRRGAHEGDLEYVEERLGVSLPNATRVLYRMCDGQELVGHTLGLIGGYMGVNVNLLPLEEVIRRTEDARSDLEFLRGSKHVVVAQSSDQAQLRKIFFLNCTDHQLRVGTINLTYGEMIPCVPMSHLRHQAGVDAMLLWLEEHVRRLEIGAIKLCPGNLTSISQFPQDDGDRMTEVVNGVQVRASAVFAPEFSFLEEGVEVCEFPHLIRMSLLPQVCTVNGTSFQSCQLEKRWWSLFAGDLNICREHERGLGGEFVLLRAGEEEYVFETSISLLSASGSVHTTLLFTIPGSLDDETNFKVHVGPLPLKRPDYIF